MKRQNQEAEWSNRFSPHRNVNRKHGRVQEQMGEMFTAYYRIPNFSNEDEIGYGFRQQFRDNLYN